MSIASEARAEAFAALLEVSGEAVAYLAGEQAIWSVRALVNHDLEAKKDEGTIDFGEQNVTRIEFLANAHNPTEPPRVGRTFRDASGRFHRIRRMKRTDITVQCFCESELPSDNE